MYSELITIYYNGERVPFQTRDMGASVEGIPDKPVIHVSDDQPTDKIIKTARGEVSARFSLTENSLEVEVTDVTGKSLRMNDSFPRNQQSVMVFGTEIYIRGVTSPQVKQYRAMQYRTGQSRNRRSRTRRRY